MVRIFQIAAVILIVAAAYSLWSANNDIAFITAVLGCVAFFLSVRTQMKDRNAEREAKRED